MRFPAPAPSRGPQPPLLNGRVDLGGHPLPDLGGPVGDDLVGLDDLTPADALMLFGQQGLADGRGHRPC